MALGDAGVASLTPDGLAGGVAPGPGRLVISEGVEGWASFGPGWDRSGLG